MSVKVLGLATFVAAKKSDITLHMGYYADSSCGTKGGGVTKWATGIPANFGEALDLEGFGNVVLNCKKTGEIKTSPSGPTPSPSPSPSPSGDCGQESDSCEDDHDSCCDGLTCKKESGAHICQKKTVGVGDSNTLRQGHCEKLTSDTSRFSIWTGACTDGQEGSVELVQTHYSTGPNCSSTGACYENTKETWSVGKCGTTNGVTTTAMCRGKDVFGIFYWKDESCTKPDHTHTMARGCYARSMCESPQGPFPCVGSVTNDWYGLCSTATAPPIEPPCSPTPAPSPGGACDTKTYPECHECCDPQGTCLACKACTESKTGACAACWQVDPTAGVACLRDDKMGCQNCWDPKPQPTPTPSPAPSPTPAHGCDSPKCNDCCSPQGSCLQCKGCIGSKSGACAGCWALDPVMGTACLYDDGHGCMKCWYPSPSPSPTPVPTPSPTPSPAHGCASPKCNDCCSDQGSCLQCKGCIGSKAGACAGCWALDPVLGTACLYDDGHGCMKCWYPSGDNVTIV